MSKCIARNRRNLLLHMVGWMAVALPVAMFAQTPLTADAAAACAVKSPGGAATYIDIPVAKVKAAILALRGLKTDQVTDPGKCTKALVQTGTMLDEMLTRIPNLVAREQVAQKQVALPYRQGDGATSLATALSITSTGHELEGVDLEEALHTMVNASGVRMTYNYRIRQPLPGMPESGMLKEFRTNQKNDEVAVGPDLAGSPHWEGFAGAWLMFLPDNWKQSRFRYLGEERINGHDTYVLAFAQIPERVLVPGEFANSSGNASKFYLQGVAWIDQTDGEIVRLHTDLLTPISISAVYLKELRSDIDFGKVTIVERNLTLWLPSNVEVMWEGRDHAAVETHTYSQYRLFAASSRIIAAP